MALKDLISDLSNFNGRSQYDKLDSQIQNGVDFIPNDDAIGFTPKTDLKSLYKKANSVYSATEFVPASDGVFSPKYVKDIFPTVFTSDFMTTPIASYVSNYPGEASLTWGNSPQKEMQNFAVGRSNTRVGLINDKRRGVFDHLTLTSFEHQPFPVNQSPNSVFAPISTDMYFSEMHGKSIHISDAGQLKAGVRYGASVGGVFTNFLPAATLTDVESAVGGDVTQFATLTPIADRTSQFSTNETPFEDGIYSEPFGFGNQQQTLFLKKEEWSKTNQIDNWRGTSFTLIDEFSDGQSYGGIEWEDCSPTIAGLITQNKNYKDNSVKIGDNDIFDFSTKGSNTFSNVPSGIGENGKQGTKDYRGVANSGPFSGNNNHPLILRDIGNKWGFDNPSGFLDTLDQVAGGFVRGAPGLAGLIDRSLTDKVRLGKLIFTTNIGLQFITKQFALQALNPTLESKIWNPASALSLTGVGDLISGLIDGARGGNFPTPDAILGAAASAAISAAIPIGHPERHLGGGRYENVISTTTKDINGKVMGRIRLSAQPFGVDVESPQLPRSNTGFGFVDRFVNNRIDAVNDGLAGAAIAPFFALSNPNRYAFPISSAPKSIGKDGSISFVGSLDIALSDTVKALNTPGGTFNKATNDKSIEGGNNSELVTRHSTLAYNQLKKNDTVDNSYETLLESPSEINDSTARGQFDLIDEMDKRYKYDKVNSNVGIVTDLKAKFDKDIFGYIKGNASTANTDKINMIPYGNYRDTGLDAQSMTAGDLLQLPEYADDNNDFIKFVILVSNSNSTLFLFPSKSTRSLIDIKVFLIELLFSLIFIFFNPLLLKYIIIIIIIPTIPTLNHE